MSKIIVITGAGVGLGRALARRFVKEGEKVVLLGRTASKVEAVAQELGEAAFALGCDVADPDSVRSAFAAIKERYGKIDVLINNAATYEPFLIAEATDKQISAAIDTNLKGPVYCSREAIPLMDRGGHIVNVSSESVGLNFPMLSIYQSSKAGLERFSESLYHELQEPGIRVTLIRAGQMMEEGKEWDVDPQMAMRFFQACMAAGINLRERPISQFTSATDIFRAVIDMPADIHAVMVSVQARRP